MFVRALATTLGAATLLSAAPASAQTVSQVFKRVRGSVAIIYTAGRTLADRSSGELVSIGGLGSGVLISDDEVLTASHVVQTADQVMVEFPTGERVLAQVVTSEPAADLALLRLDSRPQGVVPAPLGDSDLSEVGDEVFVVGAPLGASHTLTVGHVSARRQPTRSVGNFFAAEMLQTDAAINQGNSGGPMFNMNGEVIGVVSYILSQTGGFVGLGFAVTSNTVKEVLLSGVQIWSGIDMVTLDEDMSRMLNVPGGGGALVQQVAQGSLGEQLGLHGGTVAATIGDQEIRLGGDVIVAVQGIPVKGMENYDEMRAAFDALTAGQTISVRVLRGGEMRDLGAPFQPQSPFRDW